MHLASAKRTNQESPAFQALRERDRLLNNGLRRAASLADSGSLPEAATALKDVIARDNLGVSGLEARKMLAEIESEEGDQKSALATYAEIVRAHIGDTAGFAPANAGDLHDCASFADHMGRKDLAQAWYTVEVREAFGYQRELIVGSAGGKSFRRIANVKIKPSFDLPDERPVLSSPGLTKALGICLGEHERFDTRGHLKPNPTGLEDMREAMQLAGSDEWMEYQGGMFFLTWAHKDARA